MHFCLPSFEIKLGVIYAGGQGAETGVRVQFRKMQPDPCFSPYRRDSERALTRFAAALLLTRFAARFAAAAQNLTPV